MARLAALATLSCSSRKKRGAYVHWNRFVQEPCVSARAGADKAVDYQQTRFEEVVRDADVVLDTIGGDTLERSFKR